MKINFNMFKNKKNNKYIYLSCKRTNKLNNFSFTISTVYFPLSLTLLCSVLLLLTMMRRYDYIISQHQNLQLILLLHLFHNALKLYLRDCSSHRVQGLNVQHLLELRAKLHLNHVANVVLHPIEDRFHFEHPMLKLWVVHDQQHTFWLNECFQLPHSMTVVSLIDKLM